MIISPKEYPQNLPWDEKVLSMPNIPRGAEGQIIVLRSISKNVQSYIESQ